MDEPNGYVFGDVLQLLASVVATGRRAGATEEFWKRLAANEELFRQVNQVVMDAGVLERLLGEGGFRRMDEMIAGRYAPAYANENSEAKVEWLDLGACESSDVAVQRMHDLGYRPAEDPECLRALKRDREFPEIRNPIAVVGSMWVQKATDRRFTLVFTRDLDRRNVSLVLWAQSRPASYRYAAVKLP